MPISEVYNEDCMMGMARYPDKFFDLAIVDPPYGIGMGKRKGRVSKGQFKERYETEKYKTSDWDSDAPSSEYFEELFRVSKNQVVWGANHFTEDLPPSRGWIFWDKMPIVPNYSDGELAWTSFDKVLKRKVIHWNGKIRTGIEPSYVCIHPTQKPIKLYEWILHNYAEKGNKILDTHMGSQSSRIAAYKMGFDYYGWEIDPEYFDAGNKRFKEQTAQQVLFK